MAILAKKLARPRHERRQIWLRYQPKMNRLTQNTPGEKWLIVPAYQQAMQGDYTLVRELQAVLSHPYDEQSQDVEDKYYRLRPKAFF